jgi:hypothetical protein
MKKLLLCLILGISLGYELGAQVVTNVSNVSAISTPPVSKESSQSVRSWMFSWPAKLSALTILTFVLIWLKQRKGDDESGKESGASNFTFAAVKEQTIIEYLQSGDLSRFITALQDSAFLPFGSESVIKELAKAVSKDADYKTFPFLDIQMRCRTARFLHLLLERQRAVTGSERPWPKTPFDDIYYDCSFCKGLRGKEKSFGKLARNTFEDLLQSGKNALGG